VWTRIGADEKFYVNGVLVNSRDNGAGGTGDTINGFMIGRNTLIAENYFNGLIDDVRVYNRALSASEVKQLYNMGR